MEGSPQTFTLDPYDSQPCTRFTPGAIPESGLSIDGAISLSLVDVSTALLLGGAMKGPSSCGNDCRRKHVFLGWNSLTSYCPGPGA